MLIHSAAYQSNPLRLALFNFVCFKGDVTTSHVEVKFLGPLKHSFDCLQAFQFRIIVSPEYPVIHLCTGEINRRFKVTNV